MEILEQSCPLVLQKILDHLDTRTLTRIRLVNSAWNHEASTILQRRVTVYFSSWKDLQRYCRTFLEDANRPVPVLLKLNSYNFQQSLFEHALENKAFGELDRLTEALQRFAEIAGERVAKLKLNVYLICTLPEDPSPHSCAVFVYEQVWKMVYESFPNLRSLQLFFITHEFKLESFDVETVINHYLSKELPYLTKLVLGVSSTIGADIKPNTECEQLIRIFVKNLILSARNLQTLRVNFYGNKLIKEEIISNISFIPPRLSSFAMRPFLTQDDLQVINSRNLSYLTTLKINVSEDVDKSTLKQALFQHGQTLRILHLDFEQNCRILEQLPPHGVVLQKLEDLFVGRFYGGTVSWENMPKLKRFQGEYCSNYSQIFSHIPPHPLISSYPLSHLDICGREYPKEERIISCRQEPHWFLSLTTLIIHNVHLPRFSIIFECRLLNHLNLGFKKIDDEAICGISRSLLKHYCAVATVRRNCSRDEVIGMILMGKALVRDEPYIGDLKELRTLTLKAYGKLTDAAFLFGIAHCEKLQRLRVPYGMHHNLTWRTNTILQHGLKELVDSDVQLEQPENDILAF